MTVAELIDALSRMDEDADVLVRGADGETIGIDSLSWDDSGDVFADLDGHTILMGQEVIGP